MILYHLAADELGDDGEGLAVEILVDDQQVLKSRRMLARHHNALVAIRSETPRHHHLRKLQSFQLQIDLILPSSSAPKETIVPQSKATSR